MMVKLNGCICFIEDDDLLEKYNAIWEIVSTGIKKEFDSEPVYNKSFSKTKIKSYGDEDTDFHDLEMPKIDSALKKEENYYPKVFFKKCKYTEKEVISQITKNR